MQQRGAKRKPSIHVGVRLQHENQENLAAILAVQTDYTVTDALRWGLTRAAIKARRMGKRPDLEAEVR